MSIVLRELALTDGVAVREMLQEIGPGECGFQNDGYQVDLSDFPAFLRRNVDMSHDIGVEPHLVPRTLYWLFVDERPVGMGKLRHRLNDYLRENGHIGFCVRPSERGRGYGTAMLREMLVKAREIGLGEVMLTCLADNLRSRKVIEASNGVLLETRDGKCHYRISL